MPYISLHRLPGWATELYVKSMNLLQNFFSYVESVNIKF